MIYLEGGTIAELDRRVLVLFRFGFNFELNLYAALLFNSLLLASRSSFWSVGERRKRKAHCSQSKRLLYSAT